MAPTVVYALTLWRVGLVGGYHLAFGGAWWPPWGVTGRYCVICISHRTCDVAQCLSGDI